MNLFGIIIGHAIAYWRIAGRIPGGFLLVLSLLGCAAVGPDFHPPDMAMPDSWHTRVEKGLTVGESDTQSLASWWQVFDDPELNSLVKRAVSGNPAMKEALARIREARARRGIAKADYFPTLDARGSFTRSGNGSNEGGERHKDLYALEEVENALMAYSEEHQKRNDLSEATRAAQTAVELARHEYEAGLSDFSNVLDAQRSLLTFQNQLVQSQGTIASNLVQLYKSLGGGWTTENER